MIKYYSIIKRNAILLIGKYTDIGSTRGYLKLWWWWWCGGGGGAGSAKPGG